MPDAPIPPQQPQEGGGPAEMLSTAGAMLEKVNAMIGEDPAVPDAVKKAFQASLAAYTQGAQALTGGGGEPEQAIPQENASPEQGASGAQPMSMRRPG